MNLNNGYVLYESKGDRMVDENKIEKRTEQSRTNDVSLKRARSPYRGRHGPKELLCSSREWAKQHHK